MYCLHHLLKLVYFFLDVLQSNLKVLSAGLRTYDVPPDFSGIYRFYYS